MNQEKDGSMCRQNMREHYSSGTLELGALYTQDELGRLQDDLDHLGKGLIYPGAIRREKSRDR